jgi:glycosyltransferase involved in cell wall biosynthesis
MSISKNPVPAVICVQDGARLHYAIPRALAGLGWLEGVWTDFFVRPGSLDGVIANVSSLGKSSGAKRMLERRCAEIEDRVRSFPLRSLWWRRSRNRFATPEDYYEWVAGRTARWMLRQEFGGANMVHGFIRNLDPEFCRKCRERGLRTIGDQMIAPAAIETNEMAAQRQRWPGWDDRTDPESQRLASVEERTWEQLDHITCASDYVADGLVACGVARERISILPYPAPVHVSSDSQDHKSRGKLKVGYVGSVNLRKGAPVFMEMARRIKGANIEFIMVGPIAIGKTAASTLQHHVTLTGPVPRSQVARYLQSFDIFLFPSVCEGSAGVVMEALAAGLPVVTTPNSGTVVRHGIEGFIHAPNDLDGIEASLRLLLEDRMLRNAHAEAAQLRAREYDLASYERGLRDLLPALLADTSRLVRG